MMIKILGESAIMKEAMKMIHKQTKKAIWLNPLAGNENFLPCDATALELKD